MNAVMRSPCVRERERDLEQYVRENEGNTEGRMWTRGGICPGAVAPVSIGRVDKRLNRRASDSVSDVGKWVTCSLERVNLPPHFFAFGRDLEVYSSPR